MVKELNLAGSGPQKSKQEKVSKDLKEASDNILNRVVDEKLALTEIFKKTADDLQLNEKDTFALALSIAPDRSIWQALVILYTAFKMSPQELEDKIESFLADWNMNDRLTCASLNKTEDLLGLRRDSLYSIFRDD